ncbi:MAG: DUF362 domain-containing protein [Prevotella sp.]|nr:DUF362 domain-containing protein [Candidatus Prevotella equi]
MMSSKVFFTDMRASQSGNLLQKLERMVKKAGIDKIDFKDKFVAVKIHFGEFGNMAYIRPNYAAVIIKMIKDLGGKPFLTDANTLYKGSRDNAIDHLHTAMVNGFNPIATGCDVIIADGLRGKDERIIDVNGKYCPEPKIGAAIAEADIVISLTHFKGHEMAGFGGAIKNLGMGSGSVAGKLDMHSTAQPKVEAEKCIGCKVCEKNCNHDAIHVTNKLAAIDYDKCVGCGQCVALCQHEGVVMSSQESGEILNYKISEYTKAVLKDKQHFHVSFIMNVSPECDCWGHNDAAIIPDLGMACSFDPVALDQACVDLVNKACPLHTENMLMEKAHDCGCDHHHADLQHGNADHHDADKFHVLHPDTNWEAGLIYAEQIGIGTRQYELVR